MLIVEQNVRQVLKVVDRAYLLEVGRIKASGRPTSSPPATTSARRTWGSEMRVIRSPEVIPGQG